MTEDLMEGILPTGRQVPLEGFGIVGFDPPASANLGWAAFKVEGGVGRYIDSGIRHLKNRYCSRNRYLQIPSDKYRRKLESRAKRKGRSL